MHSITEVKEHLIGIGHSGTLNKVRNLEAALERGANTMLAKIDPIETERIQGLASVVHDDVYNYSLPSDYKKLIDLYPQDDRMSWDTAQRTYLERFDRRKGISQKNLTIESNNGTKFIRINWRTRAGKTLNAMNDVDDNGTWSAVATASGVAQDTITKYTGGGAVRVDLAASGDGIQNTTMTALDLTDDDEVADIFLLFYVKNSTDLANLTSVTFRWGNDLTTNYWTGVAQTAQADGTAFQVGWNLVKVPWSTATETGTVAPATVDSARITFAILAAISDIRVDNIIFSIGRNFDIKYYSQYAIRNSAGTWLAKTTDDNDNVVFEGTSYQIFLHECGIAIAHQVEGSDAAFDLAFHRRALNGNPDSPDPEERMGLYAKYRSEFPSQSKKAITVYSSGPRFKR